MTDRGRVPVKSESRRRTKLVSVRFAPGEFAEVVRRAGEAGVSVGHYLRAQALAQTQRHRYYSVRDRPTGHTILSTRPIAVTGNIDPPHFEWGTPK